MILSLACDTILILSQEALFCYPHHFRLLYSPQHSWGIRLFIHSSCTVDLFGETTYAIEIPSNSPLIGDEQRNRIWKYAAHHSWVDQSTLILTICWQETGHSQTWKFYFHENTLTLIVTDGTKGMFELSGAVSDRNIRFADMIFDGAFR